MADRAVIADRVRQLQERGYTVVSSWHRRNESGETPADIGLIDARELQDADLVIVCADLSPSSSGGMWWEMGAATAWGKHVVVIGAMGACNVFAHLPKVRRYPTWEAYLEALDAQRAAQFTGRVALWKDSEWYGFITSGTESYYAHGSYIIQPGVERPSLKRADVVAFDLAPTRDGRQQAVNIRVLQSVGYAGTEAPPSTQSATPTVQPQGRAA